MYAIVRAGGRQEKVSVGDVLIVDKVNAERDDVFEPFGEPPQPMFVGPRRVVGRKGADETQRIGVPEDRVAHPFRFGHGRNFAS